MKTIISSTIYQIVNKIILGMMILCLSLGLMVYSLGYNNPNTIHEVHDGTRVYDFVSLVQPTATFHLASNRTTGYHWKIVSEPAGVFINETQNYIPLPHAPGMTGVGGTAVFRFTLSKQAIKSGKTFQIYLTYQKPWLQDSSPAKTAILVINTLKSGNKALQ